MCSSECLRRKSEQHSVLGLINMRPGQIRQISLLKSVCATAVVLWLLDSRCLGMSWCFAFLSIATGLKIEFLRFSSVIFTCGDTNDSPLLAVQLLWGHTSAIWREMDDLNCRCYTCLKMCSCKQVFANILQCAKNTWDLMPKALVYMISTEYL